MSCCWLGIGAERGEVGSIQKTDTVFRHTRNVWRNQVAFGAFDEDVFYDLFVACFKRLCCAPDEGIFVEEDQHERGILYPHQPPSAGDDDEPHMSAVFENGEGRTFIAMNGAWSIYCKGWTSPQDSDIRLVLRGETLLKALVELRPVTWTPTRFRVIASTFPGW